MLGRPPSGARGIMNFEECNAYLKEFSVDTIIHNNQIDSWLNNIFYIDKKLVDDKDDVYFIYYFVLLAQLIQEGHQFCKRIVEKLGDSSTRRIMYIKYLLQSIDNIKSVFSQNEIEYILYLRHTACHIFQEGYEYQYKNGKLKTKRKDKNIYDVKEMLFDVLEMHNESEVNFKIYVYEKAHPIIRKLYYGIEKFREG